MERIDLAAVHSAARQRWRNGGEWDPAAAKIVIGEIADGRWYARIYDGRGRWPGGRKPCAYSGPGAEHYARATARRWMRTIGGTWVEA